MSFIRLYRFLLAFVFTTNAFAAGPVIWNGTRAKNLTSKGFLLSDNSIVDNDGSLNYIKNGHAEVGTTGWATYADAAGTTPVDCTGGSPTETFTRSTSSPLINTASFVLTKDAANRQGEGASYAFTLDAAYKSTSIAISLTALGSAGYAASDVGIYIYDVTGAAIITPSVTNIGTGTVAYTATFTATTSTSYRLCIHTKTTSATAYTVQFDGVTVGIPVTATVSTATPSATGVVTSYFPLIQSAVKTVSSADYTVTTTDGYEEINVTTGASDRTITLPACASNTGRRLIIVKADTGAGGVIIDGNASETIDGATTQTLYYQYRHAEIFCDGTSWYSVTPVQDYGRAALPAGIPGEILVGSRVRSSAITLVANTNTTVTSVSVTAGVWDIAATLGFDAGGARNEVDFCISSSAGAGTNACGGADTIAVPDSNGQIRNGFSVAATGNFAMTTSSYVAITATTTFYLVAQSPNADNVYGNIRARRVR